VRLACQEHLIPGDTLEQKWQLLGAAGFDGIELHGRGGFAFEGRLSELRRARSAGVPMPTVCVIMDHFIGDFDAARRRDAIANMKSLLSTIAEVGGEGAITPASFGMHSNALPPFRSPRSPEQDREVLLEGLEELGRHASSEGVLLYLEPLNRYEDHMLNRLAQASELCDQAAQESIKVMADLFHMNLEEDGIAEAIREWGALVGHVHLADSGRAHPGTGHIDFAAALAALNDVGFTGVMAMECSIRGDPRQVLPDVARRLRGMN
jgi:sugar phosphate isomerase/epimerase